MPQKQKISAGEKVKLVLDCWGNKISVQEAARSAGVDFAIVKMWICIYENEGIEGFAHQGQKVYTIETKLQRSSPICMVKVVCRKSAKNTEFGTDGFSEIGLRCIMFMEILTL